MTKDASDSQSSTADSACKTDESNEVKLSDSDGSSKSQDEPVTESRV